MKRDYIKLSLEKFGRLLLDENDLDPVYNVLYKGQLPDQQLRRWFLAYWCCYNSGEASWISEQEDFWGRMEEFAANVTESPIGGRWPRGRERRHFRGDKCIDAIRVLKGRFPRPEAAVESLEAPVRYQRLKEKIVTWPLFGPWIAFKIGDMLERVMGVQIGFHNSDVFFFDSPRLAAEQWYGKAHPQAIVDACEHLSKTLGHYTAPPSHNRPLNLQEYETILCKWGSHNTGHYPIGIDTWELREALHPWASISPTSARLSSCL